MKRSIKATIIELIVALFIAIIVLVSVYLILGQKIRDTIQFVNQVAMKVENKNSNDKAQMNEQNVITNYPEYGTQYATIEIPKIDVNLPVYFGDTLDILKLGVGHSSGSYFPGEGGSIIYMGHNSKNMLRRFGELQKGNDIKVKTDYGEYNYKIYDMQLVNETELDKLPIQNEKEILMIYTCYPFNNIGHAYQRYVVYAEPVK